MINFFVGFGNIENGKEIVDKMVQNHFVNSIINQSFYNLLLRTAEAQVNSKIIRSAHIYSINVAKTFRDVYRTYDFLLLKVVIQN